MNTNRRAFLTGLTALAATPLFARDYGHDGALEFSQSESGLLVTLQCQPLSAIACSLKISGGVLRPPNTS